jgi:hypothetical protein
MLEPGSPQGRLTDPAVVLLSEKIAFGLDSRREADDN